MRITINCPSPVQTRILAAHTDVLVYDLRLSRDIVILAMDDAMLGTQQGGYAFIEGKHCVYIDTRKGHIVQALAHELRHAYQTEHDTLGPYDWSIPYCDRPQEQDAVRYATKYIESL